MAIRKDLNFFESRYKSGNTPWDTGRPDKNLKEYLAGLVSPGAKVLEVGCGTGDNAIFMARFGLQVTATEIVRLALEEAIKKAKKQGIDVEFLLKDLMEEAIPGRPFDMAFDRGCFHHFDSLKQRRKFAKRISEHLNQGGIWFSLMGNADDMRPCKGPPRLKAIEVVEAVEPFFEIMLLKSSYFDSNQDLPPRCWIFIGKKRKGPPNRRPLKSSNLQV